MTYEQQITAEFEQEIAELNGKLYARDMEIERLRAALSDRRAECAAWLAYYEHYVGCDNCDGVCLRATALINTALRAASRDEERDHG